MIVGSQSQSQLFMDMDGYYALGCLDPSLPFPWCFTTRSWARLAVSDALPCLTPHPHPNPQHSCTSPHPSALHSFSATATASIPPPHKIRVDTPLYSPADQPISIPTRVHHPPRLSIKRLQAPLHLQLPKPSSSSTSASRSNTNLPPHTAVPSQNDKGRRFELSRATNGVAAAVPSFISSF